MVSHTVFILTVCVAFTLAIGSTGTSVPPEARTSTTTTSAQTTATPQYPSKAQTAQPNTTRHPSTQTPQVGDSPTETPVPNTAELPDPDTFFAWLDSIKPGATDNDTAQEGNETPTSPEPQSDRTTKTTGIADVLMTKRTTVSQGKETVETTTAAAVGPKTTEDMEWLRKMFEESGVKTTPKTETGEGNHPETTSAPAQNTPTKHGKFDLPPPDKFYEWLNSLHPKSNPTPERSNLDQLETETSIKVPHDDHSAYFTTRLGIFITVISGVLALFVTVIALCVIYRRKQSKKTKESNEEQQVKHVGEVYFNPSGYTDVFHGIPTNNDVWKNLDLLSTNAPSVLPDGERKV